MPAYVDLFIISELLFTANEPTPLTVFENYIIYGVTEFIIISSVTVF